MVQDSLISQIRRLKALWLRKPGVVAIKKLRSAVSFSSAILIRWTQAARPQLEPESTLLALLNEASSDSPKLVDDPLKSPRPAVPRAESWQSPLAKQCKDWICPSVDALKRFASGWGRIVRRSVLMQATMGSGIAWIHGSNPLIPSLDWLYCMKPQHLLRPSTRSRLTTLMTMIR